MTATWHAALALWVAASQAACQYQAPDPFARAASPGSTLDPNRIPRGTGASGGDGLTAEGDAGGRGGADIDDSNILIRTGAGGAADLPGASSNSEHLPPARACSSNGPAVRTVRRLTRDELNNTLVDLLGADAPQAGTLFDADPKIYGFINNYEKLLVQNSDAHKVQELAEDAATYAAGRLGVLSPCTTHSAACHTSFVSRFGGRAWRRPLSAAELQSHLSLMGASANFTDAARNVISALLQSPNFLYRSEMGAAKSADLYVLTPYEVASELSYLLLGSMPDEALLAAAAAGNLSSKENILVQAKRLVGLPRARNALAQFFLQWMDVTTLPKMERREGAAGVALTQATALDMQTELLSLANEQLFGGGTFAQLLATDHTFVNANLAAFYGLAAPNGSAFGAARVDGKNRTGGLLGTGAVIAAASQSNYASNVLRGRLVRFKLLCGSLGDPPPDASNQDVTVTGTQRMRASSHVQDAACSSCHHLMDPLGFTFGAYDTTARRRAGDLELGQAVDTSGTVAPSAGQTFPPAAVANLDGLNRYLSSSDQAARCMTRHLAMFAFGSTSWPQDSCTFEEAANGAAAQKYNL